MKHDCLCSCLDKALIEEILNRARELGQDPCVFIASLLKPSLQSRPSQAVPDQSVTGQQRERRRFPRRRMTLPAVLHIKRLQSGCGMKSVTLDNISLGGVSIRFIRDERFDSSLLLSPGRLEMVFRLEEGGSPVVVDCQSLRLVREQDELRMGLRFTGTDCAAFHTLAEHLYVC